MAVSALYITQGRVQFAVCCVLLCCERIVKENISAASVGVSSWQEGALGRIGGLGLRPCSCHRPVSLWFVPDMYRMDMPRAGKVNIPVNEETRDELRNEKPQGVTWDRYLLRLKETGQL